MAGCGDRLFQVAWHYRRGKSRGVHRLTTPWAGFAGLVDREYERTHADPRGEALEPMLAESPCPECLGERLGAEARAVAFGGLRFPEFARLPVAQALDWLRSGPWAGAAAAELRPLLRRRLEALDRAGLGYLAMDREMATLSGGEAQRARLAAALDEGLCGVAYVLDEPTRGLHPRDTARLADLLRTLADAGNAVVVVEHDPGIIARADRIIELGPGAGPDGGRITAAGTRPNCAPIPPRHTARALRGPGPAREPAPFRPGVTVRGACRHNLRGFDLTFPIGALVALTGVSGSGKSTLLHEVLAGSIRAGRPVGCAALEWHAVIPDLLAQGQGAAVPGGQSSVATLTGVADPLRRRFAATPLARARKWSARQFSSAVPGGRCEACQGRGAVTIALDLLPDVTVGCEECGGLGFRPEVLECTVAGMSIAGALGATVARLVQSFAQDRAIAQPLQALVEAGLGYLTLGQDGRPLSAGEDQRLRLAGLLARAETGPRAAVLLDEPTRGLGAGEVERLLAVLGRLARAGHLVVAVEHHLELIAAADWIIDLGPEGGAGGGAVVVQGPRRRGGRLPGSFTGQALAGSRQSPPPCFL